MIADALACGYGSRNEAAMARSSWATHGKQMQAFAIALRPRASRKVPARDR